MTRPMHLIILVAMCLVVIAVNISASARWFLRKGITVNIYESSFWRNHSIGKVFIAANLYQSESLLRAGSWTLSILELIDQLKPENVYLSIFENNSTDATPQLLHDFEKQVKCKHSIVTTKIYLDDHQYSYLYIKNGKDKYLSRISYLALLRNRALEPLLKDQLNKSNIGCRRYTKLLFLNDIAFSSQDALRLLRTNHGNYAAVCALDFINPVKFYDTFATRDTNGYSMGLPLYPFFSPGLSQLQMKQKNRLVRVKSCWSGMVAFDSVPFEKGLRFRSLNNELDWDASECCLIHADIAQPKRTFINPTVRVAYSDVAYAWQKRLAYFEDIWVPIQKLITYMAGLPRYNRYRTRPNGGYCWVAGKQLLKAHKF